MRTTKRRRKNPRSARPWIYEVHEGVDGATRRFQTLRGAKAWARGINLFPSLAQWGLPSGHPITITKRRSVAEEPKLVMRGLVVSGRIVKKNPRRSRRTRRGRR